MTAMGGIKRRGFLLSGAAVFGGMPAPERLRASESDNGVPLPAGKMNLKDSLLECLGGPWPEAGPLKPKIREITHRDGYRIESLSYESEPGDLVPAMLLVPDGVDAEHPVPAVAVWHQHNGEYHLGKSEPAGLDGNPMHHTGAALAKEGYVVLCPDALCFEERRDPLEKLTGGSYERFAFLEYVVAGKCLAWKNILDMRRAIDFLCSRPEVDAKSIGCYGHSMGSTHSWLVGPWEPRLKCIVGNCCLPTYEAIHKHRLLHCFPNFIPGWLQHGDTPEIASLIAPRALHLNLGELDRGSPIKEARTGVARIKNAYHQAGADEHFSVHIEAGSGHVLSDAMWRKTRDVLARHLLA